MTQLASFKLGEAYARLAYMLIEKHDWTTAEVYCRKAADLQHVVAIHCLTAEALEGRFVFGSDLDQTENFSTPNKHEAFRLMHLAARLGCPPACSSLESFYGEGFGCAGTTRKPKIGIVKVPRRKF